MARLLRGADHHRVGAQFVRQLDDPAERVAAAGVELPAVPLALGDPLERLADLPLEVLGELPAEAHRAFTAAEGWGSFAQRLNASSQQVEIAVRWGRLQLKTIALRGVAATSTQVSCAGRRLGAEVNPDGDIMRLTLTQPVTIAAGESLEITLT